MSTPSTEPTTHRAGDTLAWQRDLPDYPSTAGWVLTYRLVPQTTGTGITLNATGAGSVHTIAAAAAATASWAPGPWQLIGILTNGAERKTLYAGALQILPDLATSNGADLRSVARKLLDAVETLLIGKATTDQLDLLEVSLFSRGQKRDPASLIVLRDKLRAEVNAEERAAGLKPGAGRVLVRFAGHA